MTNYETKVVFPKQINGNTFEELLKVYYKLSLNSFVTRFDFSNVEWCEMFELSLITLWIKEIFDSGLKVLYHSPRNSNVKSFFARYEFGRFLSEIGIFNDLLYNNLGSNLLTNPYFPIKFYQEDSFKSFIDYLSDPTNYATIFSDIINVGFVNKEQLRNIIIQELGDNMYRHGKGMGAMMTMSKYGSSTMSKIARHDWRNALVRNSTPFEKSFFERLNGQEFFTIIISDKGPGISKTLRTNFTEHYRKTSVDECDIIEYAFLEHSTSRTIEERLGELSEIYENFIESFDEPPVMPPPTGLYLLLNIVKEFYGLIYIRSGHSIVVYDFLNERLPIKSSQTPKFKRLVNFGGTQIKIHFPLNIASSAASYDLQKFLFPETHQAIKYKYFNISDYFYENNKEIYAAERNSFIKFYQDVDAYKIQNLRSLSGIILDLTEVKTISTKALYLVIAKLMSSQEKNFTHVLININPQFIPGLKIAFATANNIKPIILFDTNYKREIVGVDNEDEKRFEALFYKEFFDDPSDNGFMKAHDHLFIMDDAISFKHRRKTIFKTTLTAITARINEHILDRSNNIYYPDLKVILPSRIFCEGYFEISALVSKLELKASLKQWLKYLIFDRRPAHLISIGEPCSLLSEEIIREREIYGSSYQFKHLEIKSPTSIDFSYLYELRYQFSNKDKIIIFCDVVGTTKTLANILLHLSAILNLEVFAIVNATGNEMSSILINKRKIPIYSIVTQPLKFFEERPVEWTDDLIISVDSATNNIEKNLVNKPLPLWSGDAIEEFISSIIIPENKYLVGHFVHDKTHITYLLDIPLITRTYGNEIGQIIVNHFVSNEPNIESSSGNGHIIYPFDKIGLLPVVKTLTTSLLFSTQSLNDNELFRNENTEDVEYHRKTILILDDAFDTGENLMRIIDYCVRKKAAKIYIYIIFKRGSDYAARKMTNIKLFGNTAINFYYLAELQIPTFNFNNCPICSEVMRLETLVTKLKREPGLEPLVHSIENQIIHSRPVNIKNILLEHYLFEKYNNKYHQEELVFRMYLETASIDFKIRDFLFSKIINYKDDQQLDDVVLIFKIIVKEKLYKIIDEKVESDKYEDSFKTGFLKVCQYCLNNISTLEVDTLDVMLSLLIHIDEDRFIEKLHSMISKSINEPKKLNTIFKHLYLCEKAYNYPDSIAQTLKNIKGVPESTSKYFQTIISHWDNQIVSTNKLVLDSFDKLKQCNHEIQKHIDIIQGYIKAYAFEQTILPDWHYLLDYLNEICLNLRELGEFTFDNKYIKTNIYILITNLKGLIDLGQISIKPQMTAQDQIVALYPILQKIDDILYQGEQSLKTVLDLCSTNVLSIIKYIFKIQESNFRGVHIEYDVPEVACVAFGDKNGLQAIFYNVIQNIYKHAKPTKILIQIRIDEAEGNLLIKIFDNGKKLPKYIQYQVGLSTCKSNSTKYLGSFNLLPLEEDSPLFKKKFIKEAQVILKYIKERNEIDFESIKIKSR